MHVGDVMRTPRRATVTVAGAIDFVPNRVARIGPSVAGRVSQVLVAPGQQLEKGMSVVMLESVDIGRARADFLEAESKLDRANAEVAREEKLLAAGATSERAVLQARTDQTVAQSEMRAAQARLSTLGAGGKGAGVSSVPLVTPLAGRVLEIKARMGQPVGAADTLVVVGEIDQVWLSVDVYERDFSRVRVADAVRVTVIAYPKRIFTGKVDAIDTVIDAERKVGHARIVLENLDGALRPGMTATARVLGEPVEGSSQALTVPEGALQMIDGQAFVFVECEGGGRFEARAVTTGPILEDGIEIVSGLAGDERVVTDGTFILKSEVLKQELAPVE